jgi:Fe-S-cluster containining protein
MFRHKSKPSSGVIVYRILNASYHVVIHVFNKARWNIVANEGLLYSFIVTYINSVRTSQEAQYVSVMQLGTLTIRPQRRAQEMRRHTKSHVWDVCCSGMLYNAWNQIQITKAATHIITSVLITLRSVWWLTKADVFVKAEFCVVTCKIRHVVMASWCVFIKNEKCVTNAVLVRHLGFRWAGPEYRDPGTITTSFYGQWFCPEVQLNGQKEVSQNGTNVAIFTVITDSSIKHLFFYLAISKYNDVFEEFVAIALEEVLLEVSRIPILLLE